MRVDAQISRAFAFRFSGSSWLAAPVGAVVFGKNDYSKVAKLLRDMQKLVAAKPSELR